MYKTISENVEFELVEKKSKFIANLIYVENKNDAELRIKEIKKKFYDSRHNCYAYRVLENETIYEKASDDGEPSGTAGSPMLSILQKHNLTNVLVVVTRYFGGILLGTGGLVRSYSGAALGAIDNAKLVIIELGIVFEIKIDYANFKNFEYYCNRNSVKISSIKYEENVSCFVEVRNDFKLRFLEDVRNKNVDFKEIKEIGKKYIRI